MHGTRYHQYHHRIHIQLHTLCLIVIPFQRPPSGRTHSTANLTEAQQAAIVTLRKHVGTEYAYTAGALNIGVSTPCRFYCSTEKCCVDAGLEPTLINLPATVHSTHIGPPGRKLKVRTGSTLSARRKVGK
jgi:hypothetical protein